MAVTFSLYSRLTDLAAPLIRRLIAKRAARGKEDPARIDERFGIAAHPRPPGRLIWAHAASVGESLSLLPLLSAIQLRLPDAGILVTSGTVTSASLLAKRLPPGAIHHYVPMDVHRFVARFLDHWRPDLAIFVESELWPNLIRQTAGSGAPVLLLNARLSEASYRGWRRFAFAVRPLFQDLALVLTQDKTQLPIWQSLGCRNVDCRGDLKAAAADLPADPATFQNLTQLIGARPVWLAASTHPGEEAIIIEAHRQVHARLPQLLTIIAPRHPIRGDDIAGLLAQAGLKTARRSKGEVPLPDVGVYLADTLGEMGLFYRLAPLVLIAGSLGPPGSIGGHNPLEAARLGRAILHGPDMVNCTEAAEALDHAGGALLVTGNNNLADLIQNLLQDPAAVTRMGDLSREVAATGDRIIPAYMDALEPWLAPLASTTQMSPR